MELVCAVCGKLANFDSTMDAKADKWIDKKSEGWICKDCVDHYNSEFYNKINFEGENVYEYS